MSGLLSEHQGKLLAKSDRKWYSCYRIPNINLKASCEDFMVIGGNMMDLGW